MAATNDELCEEPVKFTASHVKANIDALRGLISNVKTMFKSCSKNLNMENPAEIEYEKFRKICSSYALQPDALEKHLPEILTDIVAVIREENVAWISKQRVFRYVHLLAGVVGYKTVARLLPHEVGDFNPTLKMLELALTTEGVAWEMKYALLLWLSIIIMIPFKMECLEDGESKDGIIERVIRCCRHCGEIKGMDPRPAVLLYSRFVCREDVKHPHLKEAVDWACGGLNGQNPDTWDKYAYLTLLALLLKQAPRKDMRSHAAVIYEGIRDADGEAFYRLSRQYFVKIAQRVALCHLPVTLSPWRYTLKNRRLMAKEDDDKRVAGKDEDEEEVYIEDRKGMYVAPLVEEIVGVLLDKLKEKDVTVRSSVSKGIGRIIGRMSPEFADQIVVHILSLFAPQKSCYVWNGSCLTLAELGHRGLLLPKHLPTVVKATLQALNYEEPSGAVNLSEMVRDSACYLVWSLARAYEGKILLPFAQDLASGLLAATLFDRELNCRRAASAAFQEHVGRHGTFPHGLEILTQMDDQAVFALQNTYLNVSVKVAQYEEYKMVLMDHLARHGAKHWDKKIRDLAGQALGKFATMAPDRALDFLVEFLERAKVKNIDKRHGSIVASARLIYALADSNGVEKFDKEIIEKVEDILPHLATNKLLFQGQNTGAISEAVCLFIHECSKSKLPLQRKCVDFWRKTILEKCLTFPGMADNVALAMRYLYREYYGGCMYTREEREELLKSYVRGCGENSYYFSALGSLPKFILEIHSNGVGTAMLMELKTKDTAALTNDRINRINASVEIWRTFCVEKSSGGGGDDGDSEVGNFFQKYTGKFLDMYAKGLRDYTLGVKGDVGRDVRIAAIKALRVVIPEARHICPDFPYFTYEKMVKILGNMAMQTVGIADIIRLLAANAFKDLLFDDNCPKLDSVREMFKNFSVWKNRTDNKMEFGKIDAQFWENEYFGSIFISLLKCEDFAPYIVNGLFRSIGGLSTSIASDAEMALNAHLETYTAEELKEFGDLVAREMPRFYPPGRFVLKNAQILFTFLTRLLSLPVMVPILRGEGEGDVGNDFASKCYDIVDITLEHMLALKVQSDVRIMLESISVLCQLCQGKESVRKLSLRRLCRYLCHPRYVAVRRGTAFKLYETVLMLGDAMGLTPEREDRINDILLNYNFDDDEDVAALNALEEELEILFGLN